MIVKELKDLKKDIDDDAEIFIEKRNKTNDNFKLTDEDIKEIRDIILQQGKYKKNKNKEPDYIYYEDLVPQMSNTKLIVYIIMVIVGIIALILIPIISKG